MDVVDLYLYAAFAGGWLVGRWRPARGAWPGRASLATVVVLLGALGASFRSIAPAALADGLPAAVLFALLVLGTTGGIVLGLRALVPEPGGTGPAVDVSPTSERRRDRVPTSAVLLASLLAGYGIGREVALPTAVLVPAALVVLLALVGYAIELRLDGARRAWVPIVSAVAGATVAAALAVELGHLVGSAVFATAFGFGWYSLTGPLVAARFGAAIGLFAFLTNFIREGLTMLLSPYFGPRLRGEGLAALGGATAMDTTLYFVLRYGDRRAGVLSVASGLTLTVAASLLVPLLLAL